MSRIEYHYTAGLLCDAYGCNVEFRWAETPTFTKEEQEYRRVAREIGWTTWASRSVRHYCPDHGPRPGHKMREVAL